MVPLVLFYLLIIYSPAFQKIKKEVKAKNSLQQELWDASNAFESLLRQKSRASWLKEGDCNTVYFHKLINFKRTYNAIPGILGERVCLPICTRLTSLSLSNRLCYSGHYWTSDTGPLEAFKRFGKNLEDIENKLI